MESLLPHRVLGVDENDELIDNVAEAKLGYGEKQDFTAMILEPPQDLAVSSRRTKRIGSRSPRSIPGQEISSAPREIYFQPDGSYPGAEKRAAIFIGPEFGTVLPSPIWCKPPVRPQTPTSTS